MSVGTRLALQCLHEEKGSITVSEKLLSLERAENEMGKVFNCNEDTETAAFLVDGASPSANHGAQTCRKNTTSALGVSQGLHLTMTHQPWATCESPSMSESQFPQPQNRGEIEPCG